MRCFNHGAQLSLGNLANDIPHASFGAERLAKSIVADLFVEDSQYARTQKIPSAEHNSRTLPGVSDR